METVSALERDPAMRMQPKRALEALQKLAANPNDTEQVFVIIDALSGRTPERVLARFRRQASGQKLLRERPDILSHLRDRAALARMPRGSLGQAYLAFIDRENITPDGLVAASTEATRTRNPDIDYMRARLRDTHDLWHTVTGYQGDVAGEIALLSFNVAQLGNPGVALIVLAALASAPSLAHLKLVSRAFADGLRASWLAVAPWEELLPRNLEDVRASLRVRPAPAYQPLRMAA